MFPSAGVEYEWTSRAFHPFVGFLAGWTMALTYLVAAAAVALGFAQYLQHFVSIDERIAAMSLLVWLTAVVAVMAAFLRPAAWVLGGGALGLGALVYWWFSPTRGERPDEPPADVPQMGRSAAE